jgi:hypothetical protein
VLKGNIIKFLKAVCGVMPQAVFSSLWSGAVCTARLVLTERIGLVGQASRCGNLNQTDRKCCISRRDPAFSSECDTKSLVKVVSTLKERRKPPVSPGESRSLNKEPSLFLQN